MSSPKHSKSFLRSLRRTSRSSFQSMWKELCTGSSEPIRLRRHPVFGLELLAHNLIQVMLEMFDVICCNPSQCSWFILPDFAFGFGRFGRQDGENMGQKTV